MTPLRILQICLSPSWGGLEMSALRFTEGLTKRGHSCSCVCLEGSRLHTELQKRGQKTWPLRARKYFSAAASLKIRKVVKREEVEILHCHHLSDLWLVVPALWAVGRVALFGTIRIYFSRLKKKDFAHRCLYRRLKKLFTTTEAAKRIMAENLPVEPERISVLPNGVDLSLFNPSGQSRQGSREELGLLEGDFVIGLVGRINPGKGQLELVQAAAMLKGKHPDLRYLLVGDTTFGEGERHKRAIVSLIAELGLERNFVLTGFREDIPRILKALDLLVIPSHQETFGNTALEAMAMEVPVIGTDSGGLPEILADTGLLVPPREPRALAEAIQFLIQRPHKASELADGARRRVEELYDQEVIFDKLEQIYYDSLKS